MPESLYQQPPFLNSHQTYLNTLDALFSYSLLECLPPELFLVGFLDCVHKIFLSAFILH